MKDIIIFDYDGVLADSLDLTISIYNDLSSKYGVKKIEDKDDFTKFFYDNFFIGVKKNGIKPELAPLFLNEILEGLSKNLEKIPIFPGIKEILSSLAEKYKLVIVSSNASQLPLGFLENHGITEISEVIGSDKERSKVKKILKIKKENPKSRIFYVGDTVGDIDEGRAAKVFTVAAGWGFHSKEDLLGANPDFLAESPQELLNIFIKGQ